LQSDDQSAGKWPQSAQTGEGRTARSVDDGKASELPPSTLENTIRVSVGTDRRVIGRRRAITCRSRPDGMFANPDFVRLRPRRDEHHRLFRRRLILRSRSLAGLSVTRSQWPGCNAGALVDWHAPYVDVLNDARGKAI